MSLASDVLVCPGDVLGSTIDFNAGIGTSVVDGVIRASLLGKTVLENSADKKPTVNVLSSFVAASEYIIEIGDLVHGRVVKINYNQAFIDILSVGDRKLNVRTKGVIRREDVRTTEVDKVVVSEFFHSTDIVCARVISLGDNKSYYLSTADTNLGVVKRG